MAETIRAGHIVSVEGIRQHMLRGTSLQSYRDHQTEFKSQRDRILAFIKYHPGYTAKEISVRTGIGIEAVCGRRNELVKAGKVMESGRRKCGITGHTAIMWKLVEEENGQFLMFGNSYEKRNS